MPTTFHATMFYLKCTSTSARHYRTHPKVQKNTNTMIQKKITTDDYDIRFCCPQYKKPAKNYAGFIYRAQYVSDARGLMEWNRCKRVVGGSA
jgi:hypothetical protein